MAQLKPADQVVVDSIVAQCCEEPADFNSALDQCGELAARGSFRTQAMYIAAHRAIQKHFGK